MKFLLGLGNPGPRYEGTRHNVGFAVADGLVQRLGTTYSIGYRCVLARADVDSTRVYIVKPLTYMNLSGEVIPYLRRRWRVAPEDLLVIFDDMSLPVGKIRLRSKGSSGGHNGVKSIIQHLGTQDFPRLRIGIGQPPPTEENGAIDHVLSRFTGKELAIIEKARTLAVDAALVFVRDGIEAAMSAFNSRVITDTERTDTSD
ncbi:MAG: aminoacyl-tRNA hydrolase [Firmicutes bacterium]|nr:aminoacyl-tRNA hydrolase [Bacillota bacterium]